MIVNVKRSLIVLLICIPFLFCACSNQEETQNEQYVMTYRGEAALYENGAFYIVKDTIMYYSMEADTYVPICTKPDCTHKIDSSPDCNALTNGAKSVIKRGNMLYFFEPSESELNLICSKPNGTERRTVATIEMGNMYMDYEYRYIDDYVLCVFYDSMDIEDMEEGDSFDVSPINVDYVIKIDLTDGEVTQLLKKKDYSAVVYHSLIHENKLIYSYSYNKKDLSDADDFEEHRKNHRQGFYSLDLETGEDKLLSEGFDVIGMLSEGFDYFNPEKIICYSLDDGLIYLYNMYTDEFTAVDKCIEPSGYLTADYDNIIYKREAEDTQLHCYDLNTGEITVIPGLPEGKSLSMTDIIGSTVWMMYSDENGILCRGYMNKEDFISGNYDDFKFAHYINSIDGDR